MSRGPYTTLGRASEITLPSETCDVLHKIGQKSGRDHRELGGYVSLVTSKIVCEEGLPGTNHNTYIPSQRSLSIRNVIRFHSHPSVDFQTPPSYQDLIQICKDYVQRNDGVPAHIVITPAAFFIVEIPKQILSHLDAFIASHKRLSGIKRKAAFISSDFFLKKLEPYCGRMEKYQTCEKMYNHECVRRFLKTVKDKFGVSIVYKPYKKNMTLRFRVFSPK